MDQKRLCDLALLSVESEKKRKKKRFRKCYTSICVAEGKEGVILNLILLKVHFYGLIFVLKQKIKMFCKIYECFYLMYIFILDHYERAQL